MTGHVSHVAGACSLSSSWGHIIVYTHLSAANEVHGVCKLAMLLLSQLSTPLSHDIGGVNGCHKIEAALEVQTLRAELLPYAGVHVNLSTTVASVRIYASQAGLLRCKCLGHAKAAQQVSNWQLGPLGCGLPQVPEQSNAQVLDDGHTASVQRLHPQSRKFNVCMLVMHDDHEP